ncbi:ATP-dependent Zn protease [Candidatus Phyllobacterium onerii]|uniref:ATP-dependent Zn protease n=1 Tax=Candidatus Phyllobacterium onerii TaxID=3020828 RepID=UPI00232D5DB9|nr:ATP-dependent Zn protease [Phyllobacterium sp. IY22]
MERETAAGDASSVLRRLAAQAAGMSGADVERLVRIARLEARRDGRTITYEDLERLLLADKSNGSPETLKRIAIHEAGHAVARLVLQQGTIDVISINTHDGRAFNTGRSKPLADTMETDLEAELACILAGRAAEEVIIGSISAGSGGTADSDLAKATTLAFTLECSFGFGEHQPLLFFDKDVEASILGLRPMLASAVHERLVDAYARARAIITTAKANVEHLATILIEETTLEGSSLQQAIDHLDLSKAGRRCPSPASSA